MQTRNALVHASRSCGCTKMVRKAKRVLLPASWQISLNRMDLNKRCRRCRYARETAAAGMHDAVRHNSMRRTAQRRHAGKPFASAPRHCLKKLASGTNNQQYLCTRKPTDLD